MFRNTRQRLFLWSPFVPSTNPTFCVMLWTLLERHLRDQLPLIGPAVDQARSEIAFPRPIGPTKQGRPHPGLAWIWQQPQSVSPLKGLASLPLPTRCLCLWSSLCPLTHPPAPGPAAAQGVSMPGRSACDTTGFQKLAGPMGSIRSRFLPPKRRTNRVGAFSAIPDRKSTGARKKEEPPSFDGGGM